MFLGSVSAGVFGSLASLCTRAFFRLSRTIGPRPVLRFFSLLTVYSAVLSCSFVCAYLLRWDFDIPAEYKRQCLLLMGPIVASQVILLLSFGQFRSVLSYFGIHDLGRVCASTGIVGVGMIGLWLFSGPLAAPPRGVILMNFVLGTGALTVARLVLRVTHNLTRTVDLRGNRFHRRVGIVGAGDVGAALANDLLTKRSFGLHPVIFFDDDRRKWGHRLHGVPITGPVSRMAELVQTTRISELIITMPSAGPKKMKETIEAAQRSGLRLSIVPSFTQLASGDVQVDRFRPVELEDLLGRKPASLDSASIEELVRDQVVMVTGAGGSIGSELCRQIAAWSPRRLLLVEQSEVQLFQIEQELIEAGGSGCVVPLIADILDAPRLYEMFSEFRPQIVFHAAAHKHVVMMERQPAEAVKNNFLGTHRLAQVSREFGVDRFILISSDKAINPTSVMGATKRLAEHAIQGQQARPGNRTAFIAVRFGNVLGSSGSVIPIFKRQIAAGGPVTVTHPDVTRYFMTIPEAVGLVLQAATMGEGGEVFVLDMGTPLKIVDVARQLIELSGYRPGVDIDIKIIGLRPGEKLFEEVQHAGELLAPTQHGRVLRLRGAPPTPEHVEQSLADLAGSVYSKDDDELKRLIKKWVPEYTPFLKSSANGSGEPADAVSAPTPSSTARPETAGHGTAALPSPLVAAAVRTFAPH